MINTATAQQVIDFWFKEVQPEQWWKKSAELDQIILNRFDVVHQEACRCELAQWRETLHGRLAEIIVLDQFSRNIYRNSARAFENDALALALAQEAIRDNGHLRLSIAERTFLYMPFMHSESPLIHEQSMRLHSDQGLETRLEWEIKHKQIIDRFGRYPHRNSALGRTSTADELAFLAIPGSSF